jgi:NADH:ubiquinone oxidoreductase subunit C
MLLSLLVPFYYVQAIFPQKQHYGAPAALVTGNTLTFRVSKKNITMYLHFFRAHTGFRLHQVSDIVGYDGLLTRRTETPRFDILYTLVNPRLNYRIIIVIGVSPLH